MVERIKFTCNRCSAEILVSSILKLPSRNWTTYKVDDTVCCLCANCKEQLAVDYLETIWSISRSSLVTEDEDAV